MPAAPDPRYREGEARREVEQAEAIYRQALEQYERTPHRLLVIRLRVRARMREAARALRRARQRLDAIRAARG